jgi:hypothetical protein
MGRGRRREKRQLKGKMGKDEKGNDEKVVSYLYYLH